MSYLHPAAQPSIHSAALSRRALDLAAARRRLFFLAFIFVASNLPAAAALPLPTQHNFVAPTIVSQLGSPASHTDHSQPATAPAPSLAWRHKCDSAIEADGAFAPDGTFYVGCLGGTLYALEPLTGHRLWQFKAGGAIFAAPVVASDGRSTPLHLLFFIPLTLESQAEACCSVPVTLFTTSAFQTLPQALFSGNSQPATGSTPPPSSPWTAPFCSAASTRAYTP